MIRVTRYSADNSMEWNAFVKASKNGTFLFLREYMDYHSDRFIDHSLLYRNVKGQLLAVMPANENGDTLYSHQGLTYGGLIMGKAIHAKDVQEMLDATRKYFAEQGFTTWIYKQMPYIYNTMPAQEDEYWLWRNGATVNTCNLATVIDYSSEDTPRAEYCRRNVLARLGRQGVRLNMSASLDDYWQVLEERLKEKYDAAPVHTLQEMKRLQKALPDNIVCCTAETQDGETLAGVVLFLCGQTVHVQYSASSAKGQQCAAQDFLYLSLVNHFATVDGIRYFDFGTSNEDGGHILNTTLNRYKEGFGGRGVTYKQFIMHNS